MMEKEYRVKWDIDVDAETRLEAAQKAREIQKDPNSEATVFTVEDRAGEERRVVELDLYYLAVDRGETIKDYYYQYVLFEPDKSGPELHLLKSKNPITTEDALNWAERTIPDVNWSKDSLVILDPPNEEYCDNYD